MDHAFLTRRACPALRASVCCSQETGYVNGTALGQNPRRYAACPHAHSHFIAFHEGACHELSLSAEHVCLLATSIGSTSEHCLLESMRAKRAWIQASNARMLPKQAASNHTGSADWLRLHSTTHASCFVRRFGDQVEQVNIYLWHDDSTENLQICAFIQRALHFRSHSTCCYRGCILHLLHASLRLDSNVISFLVRQIICFLLISFCTSALVIIMSYARTLRNPSAFFSMCCC